MTAIEIALMLLFLFVAVFLAARFLSIPIYNSSIRVNAFFIGGYVALVAVFAIVALCLPANALKKGNGSEAAKVVSNSTVQLCNKIRSGDFTPTADFLPAKKYSFAPTNSWLNIKDENFSCLVGKKGVDTPDNGSGTIDVYAYMPRNTVVTYYDTSFRIELPEPLITCIGGELSLNGGKKRSLDFYHMNDASAASQFFKQNKVIMSTSGPELIIVLVPKNLDVTGNHNKLSDCK